jgi:hypothetical protein
MTEFFRKIFDSGFMPQGESTLGRPEVTWLEKRRAGKGNRPKGAGRDRVGCSRDNFERQVKGHAEELLAVKDELAAEQEAMIRLHEFGARMPASTELQPVLEEVLRASITLQSADFGIIQLYKPKSQALEIVIQNGFRQGFLDPLQRARKRGRLGARFETRRTRHHGGCLD